MVDFKIGEEKCGFFLLRGVLFAFLFHATRPCYSLLVHVKFYGCGYMEYG